MGVGRRADITGQRFGRLTAIAFENVRSGNCRWRCRCDCGKETVVGLPNLRSGGTQSCGCLWREAITSHGHAAGKQSRTYKSWDAMLNRVTNPNFQQWADYGGRGITVCERWRSFDVFLADMGERPEGRTLDRIDNDGNYEPGNCRWATPHEQLMNRRPIHPSHPQTVS